jgi:SAM-dependent methyltransferase
VDGYEAASYGDGIADVYDDWYGPGDVDAAVTALAALAGGGPVLELGVGTGRLAIPLAARGLAVTGVDASRAMLERLAAKPGGTAVTTVLGDMAADLPPGPFALVFCALNTFFNLTSAGAQAACVRAAAARLAPGGRFVLQAFVPDPSQAGSVVEVRTLSAARVVLTVSVTDPAAQTARGQFVDLTDGAPVRLRPWSIRWSTVAELDAFAAAAGLALERRHAGWNGEDFTADSPHHVSVWRSTRNQ